MVDSAKVSFFPLGNADSILLDLPGHRKLLFDFAHVANPDDSDDKRADLKKLLSDDLRAAGRKDYDVVAFTHSDNDHTTGSSEFFWLDHAELYQGKDRTRIKELWVPAAFILDKELCECAYAIRQEARHRLKENYGVRVFSRAGALDKWLEGHGIDPKTRSHLFVDAGKFVPGFDAGSDVEIFSHSPFSKRDKDAVLDRNEDSIVVQVAFNLGGRTTRLILGADTPWERWEEIIEITRFHGNDRRLEWDIFKLPHHCSYLSISPDKGKDRTAPTDKVRWLWENARQSSSLIVSTSDPIPAVDSVQPPHFQTANYYKSLGSSSFKVTMEHPSMGRPQPLVVEIDGFGYTEKKTNSPVTPIISRPSPRAGQP